MGQSHPLPQNALRVEVNPATGGTIHWPDALQPWRPRLDEAATDWYRYCRSGCGPRMWNMSMGFIGGLVAVIMLVNFLFLSPKSNEEDPEGEFSLSALSLSIALTIAPVILIIIILLSTYSGIRNNFIKLGRRLDVALQGTGYTATVHTQRREKHSRAPEGIDQGCSSLGWLWIDFIPQGVTMLPPTTVIHVSVPPPGANNNGLHAFRPTDQSEY